MADEIETGAPPDEGTTGTQDPEPTPERTFTQTEVDAIAKKERSKGKRSALAEARKAPTTMGQATEPAPPINGTGDDRFEKMSAQMATQQEQFADAVFAAAMLSMPGLELNEAQTAVLRTGFDPANPAALKTTCSELFGISAATETQAKDTQTATTVTPPTSQGVEAAYNPGPATTPGREEDVNPLKWSKTDYSRMKDRGDGSALAAVNGWRDSLSGGGQGLFRRKIPK